MLSNEKDAPAPPVVNGNQDMPLMRQYHGLKARHPDALLFFRLGDFYELFFDDAVRAAPLLEVVLTQRQNIPMCGVPHHALPGYLSKLLKLGLPARRSYHTVAGFVLGQLGRFPRLGEAFETAGWRFEVVDIDGRRVDKVLAQPLRKPRSTP